MKIKKLIVTGIAAIMAVSAMSISAFAAEIDPETGLMKYGCVDTLEELLAGLNEEGIEPFGDKNPPAGLPGDHKYWYGDPMSFGTTKNCHLNEAAKFEFEFTDTCTLNTAQYAEFFVATNSRSAAIACTGRDYSGSVNVTFVQVSNNKKFGPKSLAVNKTVSFGTLNLNQLYAIKITPKTAGKAMVGTVTVDRD